MTETPASETTQKPREDRKLDLETAVLDVAKMSSVENCRVTFGSAKGRGPDVTADVVSMQGVTTRGPDGIGFEYRFHSFLAFPLLLIDVTHLQI